MKKINETISLTESHKKVKKNINLLDKPLFMPLRTKTDLTEYYSDNFLIKSAKGLPVSYDIDILNFLLMKSQFLQNREISFHSMNDLLKQLEYSSTLSAYDRIENSIDKWESVRIKFYGNSFYYGKGLKKSTESIPILGTNLINQKKIIFRFDQNFFEMNNSKYTRDISIKLLKELTPYSKRMFEILSKNFHGREEWKIGKEKLIEKLPVLVVNPEGKVSNIVARTFREYHLNLKKLRINNEFRYGINKKNGVFWFKKV